MNRLFLLMSFLALISPDINADVVKNIEALKTRYDGIYKNIDEITKEDFRNALNYAVGDVSSVEDYDKYENVLKHVTATSEAHNVSDKFSDIIDEFKISDYTGEGKLKESRDIEAMQAFETCAKGLANWTNIKNTSVKRRTYLGDEGRTGKAQIDKFEEEFKTDLNTLKKILNDPKLDKKVLVYLDEAMKPFNKVDFSTALTAEVHKNTTKGFCRIEKTGEYFAAISTQEQAVPSFRVFGCKPRISKKIKNVIRTISSVYGMTRAPKIIDDKDLDYENAITSAAFLKILGGEIAANKKYARLLDQNYGNVTINPNFAVSGAGMGVSMKPGGTLVSNPFTDSKYDALKNMFADLAVGNFKATAALSIASLGSGQRVTAAQGAGVYSLNKKVIHDTGYSSKEFSKKHKHNLDSLSTCNQQIQQLVAVPVSSSIYTKRAKSVEETMKIVAKGGDVENILSQLRDQEEELVDSYIELIEKAVISQHKIVCGDKKERANATYQLGKMAGRKNSIDAQLAAIKAERELYEMAPYITTVDSIFNLGFNLGVMYAAEGKEISVERSLKIKDLKTPVDVGLDKDWFVRAQKYVQEMLKKADDAKRQMNKTKIELRGLLKKQVPLIPLAKLPLRRELAQEIKNMEVLKATGKKNMRAIDKAMGYHKNRRHLTPPGLYKKYRAESKGLKESINAMVSAIDEANDDTKKSYIMLNKLNVEIPKAIALRRIAKEMVRRGL